ncbi:hypothetical protein [Methanoculleus horonobensis]|uniref:hypothetical protein n=1 Tax=Methanoculleus horonobensis TaxID=528314 RepID=UPI00082D269B|nr:hypothetical protein [Methanoculleus horonobensis]
MTTPLTQINIRVPQEILDLSRALGVNRTDAAVRGLIRTVCDAAGAPDAPGISPEVEAAVGTYLAARRTSLLTEVAEIDELLAGIQGRAAERQQKEVEEHLAEHRQQEQVAMFEAIKTAKIEFDTALQTLSEEELSPLREVLESDDLGDVAATAADDLVARHGLSMPPGADPVQWLVDHLVATRGPA